VSQLEVVVDFGEMCVLAVGVYRGRVSVVRVNPSGVVVWCGGLMLRCERHGLGVDAL
jgi:hypothetical protein